MRDIQKEFNNTMDHIMDTQNEVAKQAAEVGKRLQALGIITEEQSSDKLSDDIDLRR